MLGLLGKKLGQTRVYDEQGMLIPVTVVLAGPNRVMQCKTIESDGYKSLPEGAKVSYEAEDGPKGPKAVNVKAI